MTETAHTPLPCPWKVGDKVQRKPGASYLFPGVIISVGLKLDGKTWHCEVECIAPGVEGCTHVFPASQLVPLDPAWNTRADSHHRLVEALEAAFVTSETEGNLNANKVQYKLVFKFRSLAELDAAHSAWIYRKGDDRCAD